MPSERQLRKRERIIEEHEYKEVITNGRLVRGGVFKAYLVVSDGLERKAGFIAGRLVGGACQRNRAKRMLKESYRRLKPRLKPEGFKVVFVAGKRAARAPGEEISNKMTEFFKGCGLLRVD